MCFLVVIVNGRAVSVFCDGENFIVIDSHEHGNFGGKITVVRIEDIEDTIFSSYPAVAYTGLLLTKL